MSKTFAVRVVRTKVEAVTLYVQVDTFDSSVHAKDVAHDAAIEKARTLPLDRFEEFPTEYQVLDHRAISAGAKIDVTV